MKKSMVALVGAMSVAGAIAAYAQATSTPAPSGDDNRPGMDQQRGGRWERGSGRWRGQDGAGMRQGMERRSARLSDEEIDARLRERFARLDRNSDGFIDASELEAAMSQRAMGQHAMGEHRGRGRMGRGANIEQRFFARFDVNHSGKVTRDDYLQRVREQFKRLDLNNDGKITDDDLSPMLRGQGILSGGSNGGGQFGSRRGGRIIAFLRSADANHDGQITQAEFEAAALKRFDRLDRNHDGVVDHSDFEAMRKDMVAYRVQRFMHEYGAGSDGRVSREQFMTVAKQRWHERQAANETGDGQGRRDGMRNPR